LVVMRASGVFACVALGFKSEGGRVTARRRSVKARAGNVL